MGPESTITRIPRPVFISPYSHSIFGLMAKSSFMVMDVMKFVRKLERPEITVIPPTMIRAY